MSDPIAVIGGGPAGAQAAAELARAGRGVLLIDEKLAWEKPCGGGVTDKALRQYPFLADALYARNWVRECELTSPRGRALQLALDRPMAIFSRRVLNQLLLDRATAAGAEIVHDRVVGCAPAAAGGSWELRLRSGAELRAAVVINTSGARNPLVHLPSPLGPGDWMATAGYYVPTARLPWPATRMVIRFLPGLEGYIWSFPRVDHASVGICGRLGGQSTARLRQRLEQQLEAWGVDRAGAAFYAHLLPAPSPGALTRAGGGATAENAVWLAAGDAAGLVDPITGEGLYYALRSAELLAAALAAAPTPAAAVAAYTRALQRELVPELGAAGRLAPRFFQGRFAADAVLERMILFGQRSARFRHLLCDLFSGAQGYTGLRRRLWRNLIPSLLEISRDGRLFSS
ncbi:MAG TPA: lycopene cyclase family protein [Terriglobales bacterium]|nr:lycopene cyclase family protein [Terriglobales bacterium]